MTNCEETAVAGHALTWDLPYFRYSAIWHIHRYSFMTTRLRCLLITYQHLKQALHEMGVFNCTMIRNSCWKWCENEVLYNTGVIVFRADWDNEVWFIYYTRTRNTFLWYLLHMHFDFNEWNFHTSYVNQFKQSMLRFWLHFVWKRQANKKYIGNKTHLCETQMPPAATKNNIDYFFVLRSQSWSQGHWLWCHLKGFH